MRLPKRDLIATALVMVAGILYLLWVVDAAPWGMDGTRATGLVVLGLGFAASASAVVPGFEDLIHGNKLYRTRLDDRHMAALGHQEGR